jgi:hypothetical protein
MLTIEALNILKAGIEKGLTTEQLVEEGERILALQNTRQQAIQRLANEVYAIQEDIRKGQYDESLETLEIKVI